jgi:lysophospholipase L1-like esterase
MNWETILCLGDSITIGARSYCGYPEYTGYLLEKKFGNKWNVINHAVSGYTTIDLERSVTAHFSNLRQFEAGVATIMIGTNDVKKNTSDEDFGVAYRQLIIKTLLLTPAKNVVLVRIPSLPQGVAYPYTYEMNRKIDRLNTIIGELAEEHRLRSIAFTFSNKDLFDGVHLSAEGVKNAAKQLSSFISLDKGSSDHIPSEQEGQQPANV